MNLKTIIPLTAAMALTACAAADLTGKVRETAGSVTSSASNLVGLGGGKPEIEAPTTGTARQLQAAFEDCMSGFPTFEGVANLFERRGYQVSRFNDNLSAEFGQGAISGAANIGLGRDPSGCTVGSPRVSKAMAAGIVDAYVTRAFGGKGRWGKGPGGVPRMTVNGVGPSSTTISIFGTGNSGDGPGSSISVATRP